MRRWPERLTACVLALGLSQGGMTAEPPGRSLEWPEQHVAVRLDLLNDQYLFGLVRILSQKDGDDFGYTHGLRMRASTVVAGRFKLTLDTLTDLYAERIGVQANLDDDRGVYSLQNFTSHSRVALQIAQEPAWNGLLWRAALGWERLDSENLGIFLNAAAQQQWFHNIINDVDPNQATNPLYVPDGLGVRDGLHAEAALGTRHTWRIGQPWAVRLDALAGMRVGSLQAMTAGVGTVELSVWWQRHADAPAVRLQLGTDVWVHADGVEVRPRGSLVAGNRLVSMWVEVTGGVGDLQEFPRYHERHRLTGNPDAWTVVGLRFGVPVHPLVRARKPLERRAARAP